MRNRDRYLATVNDSSRHDSFALGLASFPVQRLGVRRLALFANPLQIGGVARPHRNSSQIRFACANVRICTENTLTNGQMFLKRLAPAPFFSF
jgi:hypothetical protein